jgi:undecaprenyl diphosphate synthase
MVLLWGLILIMAAKDAETNENSARGDGSVPRHVAIIMDGNGRWAAERRRPRIIGHRKGGDAVRETIKAAGDFGVEYLTLYAFSSENWKRPEKEVKALMDLLLKTLKKYAKDFNKNQIRFHTIGDISKLPKDCRDEIVRLKKGTAHFAKFNLVLALNYGARDELVRGVNKLLASGKKDADWKDIADSLDTAGIPDPDLLIRTSGEMRLSNYLLLQLAYAEMYFTKVYWPDFTREEFKKALDDYAKRERRYGLTGEQLKK